MLALCSVSSSRQERGHHARCVRRESTTHDIAAGGDAEAVQIGEVEITAVQDVTVCGSGASACPQATGQECQKTPSANLRTFYDGATRMQQLYHSENILIKTDSPKSFSNDNARLARRYAGSKHCVLTTCITTSFSLCCRPIAIRQQQRLKGGKLMYSGH
jgi:hypothetical protein